MRPLGMMLTLLVAVCAVTLGLHHGAGDTAQAQMVAADEAPLPAPVTVERRADEIRVQASVAAPAPSSRAAPAPVRESRATTPAPPAAPQEVRSGSSSRSTASRRSRWRSRNRYPGRIPTPAEWRPPEGPVRIALQAGHWRANEAPRELSGLRDNGTSANGTAEWEVNLEIVEHAAEELRALGYEVDVLPAVVPPDYRAHLFIAVHADGSNDPAATGFRVASPRRDATGRADDFAKVLSRSYGDATGIRLLPTVTRRMSSYYAFNYRRYEHALHPMTIGVILETGFLTSARDRRVIQENPERAARGIVEAVRSYPLTAQPTAVGGG